MGLPSPLASLRLFVPPVRLLSACMWQVARQQDVEHYGQLEEVISLVTKCAPELLRSRQRAALIMGLRTKMILEMCRGELLIDHGTIKAHLSRIQSSMKSQNSDSEVERLQASLLKLVLSFLEDPAAKEHFFQEVYPVEYGPDFDKALQVLVGYFLSRLEQLLPVPNFKQTASWLSTAPSVWEECVQMDCRPENLLSLLKSSYCRKLDKNAALPSIVEDRILASLSPPLRTDTTCRGSSTSEPENPEEEEADCPSSSTRTGPEAGERRLVGSPVVESERSGPEGTERSEADRCSESRETPEPDTCFRTAGEPEGEKSHKAPNLPKVASDQRPRMMLPRVTLTKLPLPLSVLSRSAEIKGKQEVNSQSSSSETSRGQNTAAHPSPQHLLPESPQQKIVAEVTSDSKHSQTAAVEPPPAAGAPPPAAGAPLPTAGAPPPAAGGPLPPAGAPPPTDGAPPPAAGAPLPTAGAPPPAAGGPLPTAGAPPPTEGAPPPAAGVPPPAAGAPPPCPAWAQRGVSGRAAQAPHPAGGRGAHGCSRCGRSFTSAPLTHLGTHTSLGPGTCPPGGHRFKTSWHLTALRRKHCKNGPSSCGKCGKCFRAVKDLIRHQREHREWSVCGHGQPRGQCGSAGSLTGHTRTHLGTGHRSRQSPTVSRAFGCQFCVETFLQASELRNHVKTFHPLPKKQACARPPPKVRPAPPPVKVPGRCRFCGETFPMESELRTHLKTHPEFRPHQCDQCGKCFAVYTSLLAHMSNHTGEKPHLCAQCGKRFFSQNQLKSHMRSHSGLRPHLCPHCGKAFTLAGNLEKHMKIHTGERPFECSDCGKRFIAKADMEVHKRSHTGERPYRCTLCDRAFIVSSHLKEHMRRHTGECPYSCQVCGKAFSRRFSWNAHQSTHLSRRPFPCVLCPKSYTNRMHLKRHMQTHGGGQQERLVRSQGPETTGPPL